MPDRDSSEMNIQTNGQNIVLIGFMGAGKTTLAAYLKQHFGLKTVEMDQVIEEQEGKSVPDIFAKEGEDYFRARETELLHKLAGQENLVISCGGGAALREENVAEMKKGGQVVLLTASPEDIYERLKDFDDRPLLEGRMDVADISELMEQRREKYEAAADLKIDTSGKTIPEVCEELLQGLAVSEA